MRNQLVIIQSEIHAKTTPRQVKVQMSLTLENRWRRILGGIFLLTNPVFWCICFLLNDLGHFGRLAQLARAPALQAQIGIFTVHILFNFNDLQPSISTYLNISTESL